MPKYTTSRAVHIGGKLYKPGESVELSVRDGERFTRGGAVNASQSLGGMTKADLTELAEARGIDSSGNKDDLRARLEE